MADYLAALIERMTQLRNAGHTWAQIADEIGYGSARSASSTYCRARRKLGLTKGADRA